MGPVPKNDRKSESREPLLTELVRRLSDDIDGRQRSTSVQPEQLAENAEPSNQVDGRPIENPDTQDGYAAGTTFPDCKMENDALMSMEETTSDASTLESDQSTKTKFENFSIYELIKQCACSARLQNLSMNDSLFDEWSVGAAISDLEQFTALLLNLEGLGQTTAEELTELLHDVKFGAVIPSAADPTLNPDNHGEYPVGDPRKSELASDLLELSLARIIAFYGCSGRLENALKNAEFENVRLSDYFNDPKLLRTLLANFPGIGRKTSDEAVIAVDKFVEAAINGNEEISTILVPRGMIGKSAEDSTPSGVKPTHSPIPANPATARTKFVDLIANLPEKDHHVLVRRYGLEGHDRETLQQVADEVHVTRERIRQIETRALRNIKLPANRATLLTFLEAHHDDIWRVLSGGNELATDDEVRTYTSQLDPLFILALDVVHGGVRQWLDQFATKLDNGWLAKTENAANIKSDAIRIETWLDMHNAIMPAASAKAALVLDDARLELATEHSTKFSIFEGYLVAQHVGPKIRRTIRLHGVAFEQFGAQPFDIATLAVIYRERYTDDDVASRMFQMQMEEAPHLFCRLFDNIWFAMSTDANPTLMTSAPFDRERDFTATFEKKSIGADMVELMTGGPWRHINLRDHIVAKSNGRVAASSIGAILSSNPCFRRVAPGIYDIHRPGKPTDNNTIINDILLTRAHCRAFCRARHSGAPIDWYPAWGPDMELWLTRWARLKADEDLYRSLLAVIEPETWSAPDDELAYWKAQKSNQATWLVGAPRKYELGRKFVEPDRMVSTLAHLAIFGWTSWVAVNRTTDAKGDLHDAADLLSILVMASLVEAPDDWQARHDATEKAREIYIAACHEMHLNGSLSWDEGILADLLADLDTSTEEHTARGWVERDEFSRAMTVWRSGEARSGRAFEQQTSEPVDPDVIFESSDWHDIFAND